MMLRSINKLPLGWMIFFMALAVRLIHLLTFHPEAPHAILYGDSFLFNYYAQAWAEHRLDALMGPYSIPVPPLYVVYLGVLYRLFGYHTLIPQIIQLFIGSLSCVLIYKVAKSIWNREVGLFAGIIASFYGVFIYFDYEILKPSFTNFFFIASIYFLLRRKDLNLLNIILSAATLSLSILLREQLVIAIPITAVWVILYLWKTSKIKALSYSASFLALLLLLPVVINKGLSLVVPKHSGLVATGGIHFYIGNNPLANGAYATLPGITPFPKGHFYDAEAIAVYKRGHFLTRAEVNQYWFKEGMRFIRENPLAWLKIEIRKFFILFNGFEVPSDDNYPFAQKESWFLRLPLFSYAWICPLALVGILIQIRRNDPRGNLLIALAAGYALILMLTFVIAPYRLPLQVIFILFAGYAVYAVKEMLKAKKYLRSLIVLFIFALFAVVTHWKTTLPEGKYEDAIKTRLKFLKTHKGTEAKDLYYVMNA